MKVSLLAILSRIDFSTEDIHRTVLRVITNSHKSQVKLVAKQPKSKKSTYKNKMKLQPQSVKKDFNQRRR
jgi:hypothetical protein